MDGSVAVEVGRVQRVGAHATNYVYSLVADVERERTFRANRDEYLRASGYDIVQLEASVDDDEVERAVASVGARLLAERHRRKRRR